MASIQMVELVVRIVICVALLTMYIDRGSNTPARPSP